MSDRRLNPHDNDEDEEFTGTIIIPGEKTGAKDSEQERKSPITPGVTEVKYVTKEDREKQLREGSRKKLEEQRLKNLTPGMNR